MKQVMYAILLVLVGPAYAETAPPEAACAFDRASLASMDLAAFDQGPQGWRALAGKGTLCHAAIADLIAEYRGVRPDIMQGNLNTYLLYWHEGQARAFDGHYREAQELMARSRVQAIPVFAAWNLYADATAAFLRRDRPALLQARTALAALPPEDSRPGAKPANLDVVDGLIRCFERSYADAYSTCRGGG